MYLRNNDINMGDKKVSYTKCYCINKMICSYVVHMSHSDNVYYLTDIRKVLSLRIVLYAILFCNTHKIQLYNLSFKYTYV